MSEHIGINVNRQWVQDLKDGASDAALFLEFLLADYTHETTEVSVWIGED